MKFVTVEGTGQDITKVKIRIVNNTNKALKVSVPPGLYFVSTGNHQNMVTRKEYTFIIAAKSANEISIDAACINAVRPIPNKNDKFKGVARVSSDLARFLEASQGTGAMIVQAGVWALTDGYTAREIQTHLVSRDQYGNTTAAVSMDDIVKAREILNSLGIKHRL